MSVARSAFAVLLLIQVSGPLAAADPASFESFYTTDNSVSWAWIAAGALLAGGAVLATGGTASPLVAGIGTWVGNMMGLSGIAATNAGLAFLGGGSLAVGGLGMAGGAAVVSFTLSLAGSAGLDMAMNRYSEAMQLRQMTEISAQMATLCPPVNGEGSEAYRAAFERLSGFGVCQENADVNTEGFHSAVEEAIAVLKRKKANEDIDESIKEDTFLALLYFIGNDYVRAYAMADLAILEARSQGQDSGLAQYILAVSSLYRQAPDYQEITSIHLKKALMEDPGIPIMMQLLGIYTERTLLAVSAGKLSLVETRVLIDVLGARELKNWQARVALVLLPYYINTARDIDLRIGDLKNAVNPALRKAPLARARIRELEDEQEQLLLSAKTLTMALEEGLGRLVSENGFSEEQEQTIRSLNDELKSMILKTEDAGDRTV